MQDNSQKRTSVFIMGCGRSGTSLVASMIWKNYDFKGNNPILEKNQKNPNGFFEDWDVNLLNDQIIGESGVALPTDIKKVGYGNGWLSICDSQAIWKASADSIDKIKMLTKNKNFCFKDPRFSYTFPIWKANLDQKAKYIVIFRQPGKTANSIVDFTNSHENGFSFEKALELWYSIYSNILKYKDDDFLFIHLDELLMENYERLKKYLGSEVDKEVMNKNFIRAQDAVVGQKYMDMYNRLCQLAEYEIIER